MPRSATTAEQGYTTEYVGLDMPPLDAVSEDDPRLVEWAQKMSDIINAKRNGGSKNKTGKPKPKSKG